MNRRLWSREGRGLSKERVGWEGVLSVFVTEEDCKGVFPLAENTRNGASMEPPGFELDCQGISKYLGTIEYPREQHPGETSPCVWSPMCLEYGVRPQAVCVPFLLSGSLAAVKMAVGRQGQRGEPSHTDGSYLKCLGFLVPNKLRSSVLVSS